MKFLKFGMVFLTVLLFTKVANVRALESKKTGSKSVHIVLHSKERLPNPADGWTLYKVPLAQKLPQLGEFVIDLEINCDATKHFFAFKMPGTMKDSTFNEFGFGRIKFNFEDNTSMELSFIADEKDDTKLIPMKESFPAHIIKILLEHRSFKTKIKADLGSSISYDVRDFIVSFDLRQLHRHRRQIEKNCGLPND